jgi:putative nucleotidyltransferase with HDIG domain
MDPVLTAKVLKLVNSAYFGLTQEVSSLERSIIMLGLNTIKNIALSTAVLDQFSSKSFKTSQFDIDEFWKHSLGVAVAAKIISIKLGIPKQSREDFFIAGLLHDIGKLAFARYYPEEMKQVLNTAEDMNISILMVENKLLQYTHPEAGQRIAENWKLSKQLINAIQYHHAPDFNKERDINFLLMLSVYIGNYYCVINEIGFSGDKKPAEPNPRTWALLGFSKEKCFEFLERVNIELKKAMDFLKIVK